MLLKRLLSSSRSEILFDCLNNAGIVTFNRPAALNSLTSNMMLTLLPKLQEWEKSKRMVIFKGAGDRIFSAGGDVKAATDKIMGPKFMYTHNNVMYFLEKCSIPCISLMNGITVGSALPLAVIAKYSVATENTMISMPENGIGLIPSGCGSYIFPKLQFNLGTYLGLTGERLRGKDVVMAGLATHFVSSHRLNDLEEEVSHCTSNEEMLSVLNKYNELTEDFTLAANMRHLNYCFAESTMEGIIKRLEKVHSDWSMNTLNTLQKLCPTSLKLTLRMQQFGKEHDLPEILRMEYRVNFRAMHDHNFHEGVRAVLIDKDNKPEWKPKSLAEVSDACIKSYFQKLPEDQELKFYDEKI